MHTSGKLCHFKAASLILPSTFLFPSFFLPFFPSFSFFSLSPLVRMYAGTGSQLGEAAVALEEIHASGCNGAAAHAQMYIMGSILRHGTEDQKSVWTQEVYVHVCVW